MILTFIECPLSFNNIGLWLQYQCLVSSELCQYYDGVNDDDDDDDDDDIQHSQSLLYSLYGYYYKAHIPLLTYTDATPITNSCIYRNIPDV